MTVALESRMARRMSLAEELADIWCWQPWSGFSKELVVGGKFEEDEECCQGGEVHLIMRFFVR